MTFLSRFYVIIRPKGHFGFHCMKPSSKQGGSANIWWTRKWYMNLATNLRTTIAFGKTIKCNFHKCNFEYWNIIKGSSQGWFLWLVCLTDLIDTPHGFYTTRVTGTFQTVLSIWDVLFSLILRTILRVKSSTSGNYISLCPWVLFSKKVDFEKCEFWKNPITLILTRTPLNRHF